MCWAYAPSQSVGYSYFESRMVSGIRHWRLWIFARFMRLVHAPCDTQGLPEDVHESKREALGVRPSCVNKDVEDLAQGCELLG